VRGQGVVACGADAVRVADRPGVVRAARGDAEQALVLADDVRCRDLLPLRAVPPLGEDLQARIVADTLDLADRPGVGGGTRRDGVESRGGWVNTFPGLGNGASEAAAMSPGTEEMEQVSVRHTDWCGSG